MSKDQHSKDSKDQYSVMVARFPHGRSEDPDVVDWLVTTVVSMKQDPRISKVVRFRRDDTPITMSRNHALETALSQEVDFLLMIDADMSPDAYLPTNPHRLGLDPTAEPFWDSSFNFLIETRQAGVPSVIAAPYCGPPPHENIYVFQWANRESESVNEQDMSLDQYSRNHAASMRGIQRAAALPTGVFLMDMQCLDKLQPPYTYYEWSDDKELHKASTEDVTFTRDLSLRGVPLYCNWDAWAGHWKRKCVGRPQVLTAEAIGDRFRTAVLREFGEEQNHENKRVVNWPPATAAWKRNGAQNGAQLQEK
jgi:hypothetical protein